MTTPAPDSAIDVDVHLEPPPLAELLPMLSDHYSAQITESGLTTTPQTTRWYPPAMRKNCATSPAEIEVDAEKKIPIGCALLTCLSGLETIRDYYLGAALITALNNWLEERIDAEANMRGTMCLPLTDPDAAVEEIERRGRDKFVRVLLPIRSDQLYGNKRFHRIFEACARHDLAVALHAWGGGLNPSTPSGAPTTYVEDYLANSQIAEAQITSIIAEGVLELYPALRISLLDCGFAWLPGFLWRLNKDWKGLWREVPWVKRPPVDYFYEHFRVATAPAHLPRDPRQAREVLDMLRAPELLMFGSGHPHPHAEHTGLDLAALPQQHLAAIVRNNAAAHYRI
ncbi:amidohydrolase family protein [Nocardia jiangxiensis]|uniref:Amidohydrolase family protein n=1 Tax=Nocardia jiangxiensis TaxID=282685 RepID=A0ABW6S6U6_9NOCA